MLLLLLFLLARKTKRINFKSQTSAKTSRDKESIIPAEFSYKTSRDDPRRTARAVGEAARGLGRRPVGPAPPGLGPRRGVCSVKIETKM